MFWRNGAKGPARENEGRAGDGSLAQLAEEGSSLEANGEDFRFTCAAQADPLADQLADPLALTYKLGQASWAPGPLRPESTP
jgi:hypothetical protein